MKPCKIILDRKQADDLPSKHPNSKQLKRGLQRAGWVLNKVVDAQRHRGCCFPSSGESQKDLSLLSADA